MERQFDLNIEKILDNWEVHHAVREIIANALDEMVLTNSKMVTIEKSQDGYWHIRDYGRGLQYHHLTQNENEEKKKHPAVIGRFGVGLKDALAVLYKKSVYVRVVSKYGEITLGMRPKKGFPDTNTLHALISEPVDDHMIGTEFILGVNDNDIKQAKSLFLLFSGNKPLDTTQYGEIYRKNIGANGAIYFHGVKIAEEIGYLFDYNITKSNTALEKSLNRERSAVGRTAYSELVKRILLNAKSDTVTKELVDQLDLIPRGTGCDEIQLREVQKHAIKLYNATKRLVFVPQSKAYKLTNDDKEKILQSDRKVVIIPDSTFDSVAHEKDYNGNEIGTFTTVLREYHENFKYRFIDEIELTEDEKAVLDLKKWVISNYGNKKYLNKIYVSENINEMISGDVLGVYEREEDRIIIKRDVLKNDSKFCEVLFHELVHATTGFSDNSRVFENELGKIIGKLSSTILSFNTGK